MRVLFIKPRFKQPILDETKLTTFRGRSRAAKRPKGPPKVGVILSFRMWGGRPYGKGVPQIEVARAICTGASPASIHSAPAGLVIRVNGVAQSNNDYVARRDGFKHEQDMHEFFESNGGLPFEGYVIRWESIIKPVPNPDY